MIAALIVACEITFWVVLLSGLTARYVLRRPGLGAVLLVATPLVDVALLAFTLVDLRDGATASTAHALAAVYIGISVAFGHRMVRWADARFAHRFAGVPAPPRPPRAGREHAAHERRGWLRHLAAWAIGVSLMLGGRALVGDADRTEALVQTAVLWTLILAIDFLVSFSYTLFPRRTHYPPEPGHDEPSSCADDRPRCGGGNVEGVHRVASSPGPTHRRAEHQEAADGAGPGAESRGRPVGQSLRREAVGRQPERAGG